MFNIFSYAEEVAVAIPVTQVGQEVEEAVEESEPVVEEPEPEAPPKRELKYNEAHKCYKENSESDPKCKDLAKVYRSLCPQEWVDNWNEARENGNWWGKY
ncbi:hypothetical protein H632_c798p1 [Helicosporidium sp. ATCC 50920]|nr:hypothetical protein H632_c798p1 [Helicosporidium sp. ATCC 50920]|eukprot:KDD75225.1 hypothetical protein H632_c798p1 [Helicosporidium sp. ATCC 50920]